MLRTPSSGRQEARDSTTSHHSSRRRQCARRGHVNRHLRLRLPQLGKRQALPTSRPGPRVIRHHQAGRRERHKQQQHKQEERGRPSGHRARRCVHDLRIFACAGPPNTCADLKYCGLDPTDGTLCQYFTCRASMTVPIPDTVSWEEAGSIQPQPLAIAVQLARRASLSAHHTMAIW